MANVVKLKRGSGSDPSASDMVVGEPVIRTDTAELFFKKDDGSVAKVSGGGGGPDFKYLELRNAANNGAASYPNADFTLVTSGTTNAITPTAANTLLVSVNGVIQKPNTGTSTPSSGFALSGSTIKFGGNISAAPDFILYQESGGIGEPSDETVGEDKLKVSNSPVNGYFLSAQSGNTGGLTWAAPVATSCTGNSATATALATARAINGVNFDGTAAITVTAAAGTLSGTTLNSSVVTSSLTSLGDLAGLTVDGDATFTGAFYNVLWDKSDSALEFVDNARAIFGTGNDLQIYHDGSNSYIDDAGTGNLYIRSSQLVLQNAAGDEDLAILTSNGAVKLYFDDSKKFETAADRVNIYGHAFVIGGNYYLSNGFQDAYARFRNTGGSNDSNLEFFVRDSGTEIEALEITKDAHIRIPNDNKRLKLGAGDDLQIYHDGTDNILKSTNGEISLMNGTDYMFRAIPGGANRLYHDNSTKAETLSTGFMVNGDLDLVDNNKIRLGASQDLQIYHDGTNSYLQHGTVGNLRYQSGNHDFYNQAGNEFMCRMFQNGGVNLYYDSSLKFETTSAGVAVTGQVTIPDGSATGNRLAIGDSQDLALYHNGSNSFIADRGTGPLYIRGNNAVRIESWTGDASGEAMIIANSNGNVQLYYDNNAKFSTESNGATTRNDNSTSVYHRFTTNGGTARGYVYANSGNEIGFLDNNGSWSLQVAAAGGTTISYNHLNPSTNNSKDLGTSSTRWRNIYTNDLNLSNEGGANDVDGTWGSYTIQEGAEDLFLVNKRSGKKYKFNLTEVS